MKKRDITSSLITLIIIINISFISATNIYEETFSKFNTAIVGFIISLIPAIILLLFTIIALRNRNKALIMLQFILWCIFTVYVSLRAITFIDIYFNIGIIPELLFTFFSIKLTENFNSNADIHFWYVLSIFINAGVGLLMSIGNNKIKNFLIKIL